MTQRATAFLRRELRVWSLVDVEFLTTYILSLLKAIDIRSEPAVRLISEYLETPQGPNYPRGAEHFAHELYSFLRSPYKDLRKYDEVVQVSQFSKMRLTISMTRFLARGLGHFQHHLGLYLDLSAVHLVPSPDHLHAQPLPLEMYTDGILSSPHDHLEHDDGTRKIPGLIPSTLHG